MEENKPIQPNTFGLSKKTNVAIAAISGITITANFSIYQAIVGVTAITIIALYHLYNQSKIDFAKIK